MVGIVSFSCDGSNQIIFCIHAANDDADAATATCHSRCSSRSTSQCTHSVGGMTAALGQLSVSVNIRGCGQRKTWRRGMWYFGKQIRQDRSDGVVVLVELTTLQGPHHIFRHQTDHSMHRHGILFSDKSTWAQSLRGTHVQRRRRARSGVFWVVPLFQHTSSKLVPSILH